MAGIATSFCDCVNTELNILIDQFENKVNNTLRDLTRLDNKLRFAPNGPLTIPALEEARDKLLQVEQDIRDSTSDIIPVPEGSKFGGFVRCLQDQINRLVEAALAGLDLAGLIPEFCFFIRANSLQKMIDKLLPQIDLQTNICQNPTSASLFQARVSNGLGSIGADASGKIKIENLTDRVVVDVGTVFKSAFDISVSCCNNIFEISTNDVVNVVKDFGNPFNPTTFEPDTQPFT
jgi:hypothetical protein